MLHYRHRSGEVSGDRRGNCPSVIRLGCWFDLGKRFDKTPDCLLLLRRNSVQGFDQAHVLGPQCRSGFRRSRCSLFRHPFKEKGDRNVQDAGVGSNMC